MRPTVDVPGHDPIDADPTRGAGGITARPPPVDDPTKGDVLDEAVECLGDLSLRRFDASGASFGGRATLSWEIDLPSDCVGVQFEIDHQRVNPSGQMTVAPRRTRTYTLSATVFGGSGSKALGSTTVVGGSIVGYSRVNGDWRTTPHPATHDPAATAASEVVGRLDESRRRLLLGKVIELHLIPFGATLTDLPPWDHLTGTTKGGDSWDDADGAGGRLREDGRIVMAVAEKELVDIGSDCRAYPVGYVLIHEMAHTILGTPTADGFRRHAVSEADLRALEAAFDDRLAAGGPSLPGVSVLGGNKDFEEYWADGTAAFFGTPWDPAQAAAYTPNWLEQHDRPLFELLQRVY